MNETRIDVVGIFSHNAVAIGLMLRFMFAWLGPLFLDDGNILSGVAYTDIDYHVFSDAADHVKDGGSPYSRHTYRYTPFLALLLARLPHPQAGRFLFCIADTLCGFMISKLRQKQRTSFSSSSHQQQPHQMADALWWLYNPLSINICTRGSAESLMVLLPVLITVWIVTQWRHSSISAVAAGVSHGLAIHTKLYPIIYSLSFALCFLPRSEKKSHNTPPKTTFLVDCLRQLLQGPLVWTFALVTIATFSGLTYASYVLYGSKALQDSLFYHFSRVDHRHNYSMHWYGIYLAQAANQSLLSWIYFVPQVVLLALVSLTFAGKQKVMLALFLETLIFVSCNKVITAQYFTWYLCLLPLCSSQINWSHKDLQNGLVLWLCSTGCWLFTAYRLEIVGLLYYRQVWIASALYFMANVNLIRVVLQSTRSSRRKKSENKIA
jgi:phosphatidylinositol glycan class M